MATHFRTCPLCEATCGIAIETRGNEVVSILGDRDDPLSQGYICPKARGLKQLYEDPARLRRPRVRRGADFHEVSWTEALDAAADGLERVRSAHGADALAVYLGN